MAVLFIVIRRLFLPWVSYLFSIGAKHKVLIWQTVKDNLGAFGVGIGASVVALLAFYIGFTSSISVHVTWHLFLIGFLTLLFLCSIVLFASYMPLRPILQQPVNASLRGRA